MSKPTQTPQAKSPASNAAKIPTNNIQSNPHTNANLNVNLNLKNDHVIVDIAGSNGSQRKLNIFDAIKTKDFDTISLYVKAGGNVNVKNNDGYTPLMQAIQNNWKAPEVKKMLDNMPGVDLSIYAFERGYGGDKRYGKPIDMAIISKDVSLVKVLAGYAGKVTIEKETIGQFQHDFKPSDEIFKIMSSHLNTEMYGESENSIVIKLIYANFPKAPELNHLNIVESILSQPRSIPEKFHAQLLGASIQTNSENAVDLLIDKYHIGTKSIPEFMHTLAKQDKEAMFMHILKKDIDKSQVIEFMSKYQGTIPGYSKYTNILGMHKDNEAGTIYLSDVIDNENNVNLNDNNIHVDVKACQHGQCVHVEADVNPQLPKVIEGVVI
ncbi:MAG: hypothetical protein AB7I18_00730 [Candidatus Berkiella sp.]